LGYRYRSGYHFISAEKLSPNASALHLGSQRLSATAERQQTNQRATQDQEGWIDPAAEQYREHDDCDEDGNHTSHRPPSHGEAPGEEQADGDRGESALNRRSPWPLFQPDPQAPYNEGEQSRRQKEGE